MTKETRVYQAPNETQFYEYLGFILYPDRSMFNCTQYKKDYILSAFFRIKLFLRGLIKYNLLSLTINSNLAT